MQSTCLLIGLFGEVAHAQPAPVSLTTIRAIRSLSPVDAGAARPLRLRGIVTAMSGWKNSFFLQDSTGGISVDRTDTVEVSDGDEVDITGVSGAGKFAPVALASHVRVLGKGRVPTAKPATYLELSSGTEDSRWVELKGVVREASIEESWGRRVLLLTLSVDGATVVARVYRFKEENFDRLIDSAISLQGVCGTVFNDRRQLIGVRVFVPGFENIQVAQAAALDPFHAPELVPSSAFQFASGLQLDHRVRVRGTVVYQDLKLHRLYLQHGNDSVVLRTVQRSRLQPGVFVEASGFVIARQNPVTIESAIYRETGVGPPVAAVKTNAVDIIQKQDGFAFAPLAGHLIETEGTVVEQITQGGSDQVWGMRDGDTLYRVRLETDGGVSRLPRFASGSRLRLTGICEVESGDRKEPESFAIRLRGANDLELLQVAGPPEIRLGWFAACLLVACLLMLAWVFQVRGALKAISTHQTVVAAAGGDLKRWAHLCGLGGASIGALVLVFGWIFDIEVFRAPLPGSAYMRVTTALGFVVAGFGVWRSRRTIGFVQWLVVAVVVALPLLALSGLNLPGLEEHSESVRMSPVTALCFILTGVSLVAVARERTAALAQSLSCFVMIPCILNIIGQFYGVRNFFVQQGVPLGMAVHSSLALLLISMGILFLRSDVGLMATLTSRSPGGAMARRLIPAAIVVPIVIGCVRWQAELMGVFDTRSGLTIYNVSNIVVFIFLIWGAAGLLNVTDSDLVRAELKLLESERRYRTVVESLPQMVWTVNAEGSWNYVSPQRATLTGVPQEAQLGLGWAEQVHPDERQALLDFWSEGRKCGKALDTKYRIRDAQGQFRWFRAMAVPIRDSSGNITEWFGTCTDIEDYKQSEARIVALNASLEQRVERRTVELVRANRDMAHMHALLQGVLDSAVDVAIIATDLEHVIRIFNAGAVRMLQYSATEIVGRCTPQIFHLPGDVQARSAALSAGMEALSEPAEVCGAGALDGMVEKQEWIYVRKDGSPIDVTLSVTNRYDPDGVLIGYLGIASDVTTRKALEQQMRRNNEDLARQTRSAEDANRAKSEFLATMSHEIRTPMNSILGMAELLWESELTAEQRQYVTLFRNAGSTLVTLINDILDHSKIESGHLELEQVNFDLEEVVNEAVELVAQRAREKGLALLVRFPTHWDHTFHNGDPMRTRQVLINLLGNAVKFTEKGQIVLSVEDAGAGMVQFSVIDTGIGITADHLDSIFAQFVQADSSTTRRYGGTGLGLAISRRIAEQMGGSVTASSVVGEGSTFRFCAQLGPAAAAPPKVSAVSVESFAGERVLVVDDNPTQRLILRETLRGWGFEVDDFGSPAAALMALPEKGYSLVLLDSRMPGMDGFELAAKIRAIPCELPLIMLSSDQVMGDLAKRQRERLAGYALKPVRRSELLQQICGALHKTMKLPDGPSPRVAPQPPARPLQILVAEDGEGNRQVLTAYFKKTPHRLTFVENGQEAVRAFSETVEYDLILMDMNMPVMDGRQATRAIRLLEQERGLKRIPVVALTASAGKDDIESSLAAGCDHHLAKPISKARILRAVEEYCPPIGEQDDCELTVRIEEPGDEDLVELIPGYVASRRKEVDTLLPLLAASNFDAIRTVGHDMKGTGTCYGLPDLTVMGGELEAAARRADTPALTRQISGLASYLLRVEAALEARLAVSVAGP